MNRDYCKLSKNAMICMYITAGILDIIVETIIVVLWRIFFPNEQWALIVVIIISLLLLLELIITPYIRFQRYSYYIDDECIDILEGILWVKRNIVPMERLHQIAVHRGPIDTMLGLGKVSVTTAGGDVEIRFLEVEKADRIAESLKQRINQIVVETRENQ